MFFGNRSNKPYPRYLELGTKYMQPRPVYRRTIEENETEGLNIVGEEVYKELVR